MRDIIIQSIKDNGWLDYNWRRNKANFSTYIEYLQSLDDSNLLETYVRINRIESNLD